VELNRLGERLPAKLRQAVNEVSDTDDLASAFSDKRDFAAHGCMLGP
jgi:hypothetical protein